MPFLLRVSQQGALKKAERYSIIPRDLHELTDLEVKSWGHQVALTLYFYQYSDLEIALCFNRESILKLDSDFVKSELTTYPGIQSLFNAAAQQLDTLNLISGDHAGVSVDFGLRLQLEGFQLSGEPVVEVDFRGKARLISEEVCSPAVFVYGQPRQTSRCKEVTIETFSLGNTSIVHDGNRISIFLDLSQVNMPPFCQFRFFEVAGQEEMDHEVFELAGIDKLWVRGRMTVNICST